MARIIIADSVVSVFVLAVPNKELLEDHVLTSDPQLTSGCYLYFNLKMSAKSRVWFSVTSQNMPKFVQTQRQPIKDVLIHIL